jgi:polyhydroxyalkanoate synthase
VDPQRLFQQVVAATAGFPPKIAKAMAVLAGQPDYRVAQTPADVVHSHDKMRLLRYRPDPAAGPLHPVPVLIVYALINRYIMLDLEPQRSFVQNLLAAGLDVYLIDWGRPSAADRFLDLGDYINGYLDEAVERVRQASGSHQVNLMGICMGGTFSAIYTALHPEKVKNLITLAAPSDFDVDDAILFAWAKRFNVDKIVDVLGNLPGDLANLLYLLVVPVDTVNKYIQFVNGADNPKFVGTFLRMEKWIFDSPDMAAEVFRQYTRDLIQQNLLIQNRLLVEGRQVNLKTIACPLLNVFGNKDYLAPPSSAKPLSTAVGSADVTTLGVDCGHVGIFVGSTSAKTICPLITEWIRAR